MSRMAKVSDIGRRLTEPSNYMQQRVPDKGFSLADALH